MKHKMQYLIYKTLLSFFLCLSTSQSFKYNGRIQTRKLFLFGPDNGFKIGQFGTTHTFIFQQEFQNVPRIGLAVYTLDFQYSPDFSCRITSDSNKKSTGIRISTINQNKNNMIYIMYIATDHQQMGIFVPDRLYTNQISLPSRTKNYQNFNYNFKDQISSLAQNFNDINLSVYLTGISTTSQMTNNGYSLNRTSFSLTAIRNSKRFYTIQVLINQNYNQVLLDWIQCTVVYFIPNVLKENRYHINSGEVFLKNYGGSLQPVQQSINLNPLQNNQKFQKLNYFFGINRIDCKNGGSIALLGVQKYFTSTLDKQVKLLIQMQTWKLTFIQTSSYNYIQYKSLKCIEANANCKEKCGDGVRPFFIVQNNCNYCHYSCLACNQAKSLQICDTCHESRQKNLQNQICQCKPKFYQTFTTNQCLSCFPCQTCQRKNLCITCLQQQNMILNKLKNQCQCKPGYSPNYQKNQTSSSMVYSKQKPCVKCSQNCLYCLIPSNCLACNMKTYLFNGSCHYLCNQEQKFNYQTLKCQKFQGDSTFQQKGRLGFDTNFKYGVNQIIIEIVFSQPDIKFYYYQNDTAYDYNDYKKSIQYKNRGQNNNQDSSIYFDDGIYSNGYQNSTNSQDNLSGDQQTIVKPDQSALNGQFYGLGQANFFSQLYSSFSIKFKDKNKIPYGKHKISTAKNMSQNNFISALSQNFVFKIAQQTIPYTIQAKSNHIFFIKTKPIKSYINQNATIEFKNPGLIRQNLTALQQPFFSTKIQRFDFYSFQQISTAKDMQDLNSFFIQILWTICKFFLFVGFGWPFTPIMLALQFIMSLNYINGNIPLNLDYFLSSFRDFRNPSILFNPTRKQFDNFIFTHPNMYKSFSQFEQFDYGIDFMKNSFQFYFVPFLAMIFLGLLYLLNIFFRKCLKKNFCMISDYLVPRAFLLISAYTLVQALPISIFFFAQLNDTTFINRKSPSSFYSTFNISMAYLAFFLTCTIPLLLLAWIYYHFNYGAKINKFNDAKIFNKIFLNKIQNQSGNFNRSQLHDPLWGGNQMNIGSYVLGLIMFNLPVIIGFFLSFFINSFAWQIIGYILFMGIFLAFLIAAPFFKNRVIQVFLIFETFLFICYLFLHAGLGSNKSINTFDQWNTGYFGIDLLFTFIITSMFFAGYLIYEFLKNAYIGHKKYGCWTDVQKQAQFVKPQVQVQRVKQYRKDNKLKSTFLKKGFSNLNNKHANPTNSQTNKLMIHKNQSNDQNNLSKKTKINDEIQEFPMSSQRLFVKQNNQVNPQNHNPQQLLIQSGKAIKSLKEFKDKQKQKQIQEIQVQVQMNFIQQDSKFYIFQNGNKQQFYIPKEQIDTQLPIQMDQNQNILQNGKLIITKQQINKIKNQKQKQNKTSTKQIIYQSSKQQENIQQQNNIKPQQISIQNTIQKQQQQIKSLQKIINQDNFYSIILILSQNVNNYAFNEQDIILSQKHVRGNSINQKIQQYQLEYQGIAMAFITGQTDQNEEYWINL